MNDIQRHLSLASQIGGLITKSTITGNYYWDLQFCLDLVDCQVLADLDVFLDSHNWIVSYDLQNVDGFNRVILHGTDDKTALVPLQDQYVGDDDPKNHALVLAWGLAR